MDEKTAIRLCLDQRDVRGFEFLFEKFRREAYVHAITLLGNREEAADACQDAFGKAFVAIRRLASLDAFYPWFYRILRNHCLNRIAGRQTAAQYEDRLAAETATTRPVEKPYFLLEAREEQAQVWDALRHIKAEFREILVRHEVHRRTQLRRHCPAAANPARHSHEPPLPRAQSLCCTIRQITQEMGQ